MIFFPDSAKSIGSERIQIHNAACDHCSVDCNSKQALE
jgi:hypothetical protein